jgi:phospholipid-binding lipoprotein MlaA
MRKLRGVIPVGSLLFLLIAAPCLGQSDHDPIVHGLTWEPRQHMLLAQTEQVGPSSVSEKEQEEVAPLEGIPDPLEPVNRAFFQFNDKLYFWVLKPVATGYKAVVPEPARVGVSNFFRNLTFPVRFVNCLLQGKIEGASMEFSAFIVNTFMGLGGLFDPAKDMGFRKYNEDLDQSLAVYGLGFGFYIDWPFLGPSSLRGTFGLVGDAFLDPVNYLDSTGAVLGTKSFDVVNRTSLSIGEYESLKKAALDPYVALRNAYYQNRLKKIAE